MYTDPTASQMGPGLSPESRALKEKKDPPPAALFPQPQNWAPLRQGWASIGDGGALRKLW